jgi:phosphoglycolate phosphatase-like HAD superfamily hydrolase
MNPVRRVSRLAAVLATGVLLALGARAQAQVDPLPSWNDGPARKAILEFVRVTTDPASPAFVKPEARLATFDQDGTLWVEHPAYSQLVFAFDRVVELAPSNPEWKTKMPFAAVVRGDRAAMARFTKKDLETLVLATHPGMTTEAFDAAVKAWIVRARDGRWKRPYTDLVYQPMLEVMRLLRASGYRTCIVTGGGQGFVRAYAAGIYDVPPEQVIGTALATRFAYARSGEGVLVRSPKLLLDDNFSGKPEDIDLFTGRRPQAAFGNSTGDRQMLEFAQGSGAAALAILVLHDDAKREYAYGPAQGLPAAKVGTFTQELYDEAKRRGWVVVSMKDDWKRIFAFEP